MATMNFTKEDKELEKQIIEIRKIIHEILKERLSREKDEEMDFINHYITMMREIDALIDEAEKNGIPHKHRRITEEEIMHQLISFYFAGIDTTGHLVAFALYALAEYKDVR